MTVRLLAGVFLLVVTHTTLVQAEPQTGRWQTNYGPIEMTAKPDGFVGTYAYKNRPAHLAGRPNGDGSFGVIWVQEISEIECREEVQGSPYWGRARFVFDGDRFIAHWNYCDRRIRVKRDFRWTGTYADN